MIQKKLVYLSLLALPVFIMSKEPQFHTMSQGAPVSSSGAPNEGTCAKSGCHDDNSVNAGTAFSTIDIGGGVTEYIPGNTYKIKVSIADAGINRFGFQLAALRNSDEAQSGNMVITDALRTQILKNDIAFTDRQYATYTFPGTAATQTGLNEWELDWQAPSTDEGAVTFYLATLSGNDDGTDKLDHVYTKQITLNPSSVTGINSASVFQCMCIPMSGKINLSYKCFLSGDGAVNLIDLSGKTIKSEKLSVGTGNNQFDVSTADIPTGIYLLQFTDAKNTFTQKVVIQN